MELAELLKYVEENAKDVSDLATVDTIKKSESCDPYRQTLIKEIRTKYEDEALEAEREEVLKGWI